MNRFVELDEPINSDWRPFQIAFVLVLIIFAVSPASNIFLAICGLAGITSAFSRPLRIRLVNYFYPLLFVFLALIPLIRGNVTSWMYYLAECKLILIFLSPSGVWYFLIRTKTGYQDVLRAFLIMVWVYAIVTSLRWILFGEYRLPQSMGMSIYISYAFCVLFFIFKKNFNLLHSLVLLIAMFFLGSRTGLVIYLFLFFLRNIGSTKPAAIIITGLISCLLGGAYSLLFRGQDLLEYENLDRYILASSAIDYAIDNFEIIDFVFGFGNGRGMLGFSTGTLLDYWIMNTFTSATSEVYSFIVHNEYIRIFYDYGLMGLIVIPVYYARHIGGVIFVVIFLAMTTNSVLFSSTFVFFLSLAMAINELEGRKAITASV